ncbi:ABC transporter substrate-binding protein [Paenibacillus swuensis]|nr:ABC transporter substrate-binding protein [Paenibacillus swuensis]
MRKIGILLLTGTILLAGCGAGTDGNKAENAKGEKQTKPAELKEVKVVLDWTPNTNHTGLYVARDQGYYKAQGLDVEIIQPGQSGADQMVATGSADFGVSYQEGVTLARLQNVPLVSLAAVIQHNTSGFAAPVAKGVKSPKDFEGKTYGGFGSPAEEAMLDSLMQADGADVKKVKIVQAGDADFFTMTKRDVDFAWIYYAWTGVEAELRKEPIDMVYLNEFSEKLDYYTPVIVTNEEHVNNNAELVKKFMAATAKGYQYAIDEPEQAAELLIKAEPDLDPELVRASQKWLSPKYQDDAKRWGEQKLSVWEGYAAWMQEYKLIDKPLEAEKAFTNDFLPE